MTSKNNLRQLGLALHTFTAHGDQEPELGLQAASSAPQPVALLLPAVNAAREAARRGG